MNEPTNGYRKSEHPRYHLAIHTRSRLLGTLNLAVALGGRSSGWGGDGKPRRTFVGRHRACLDGNAPFHRAIELVLVPFMGPSRTLFRIPLGSGIASLRTLPGVANRTHASDARFPMTTSDARGRYALLPDPNYVTSEEDE